MAVKLEELIAVQPLVPILTQGSVASEIVDALLFGLEEEGIPTITGSTTDTSINKAAKEIAQLARLNIGIGVSEKEQLVILHHRDLPTEAPLFSASITTGNREIFRRIGANAARLVKGNPLLFADDAEDADALTRPKPIPTTTTATPELIGRIVREILKQLATRR